MSILEIFKAKTIKEEYDKLEKDYNLLGIEIEKKIQEIDNIKDEKNYLSKDLQKKKEKIVLLESKIQELEKIEEKLKQEAVFLKENTTKLDNEIAEKNIEIQDLKIKIENLNWQNTEKQNTILLQKKYIDKLEKQNDLFRDTYENKIEILNEEILISKNKYIDLEEKFKKIESEYLKEKNKNEKILENLVEYKKEQLEIEENNVEKEINNNSIEEVEDNEKPNQEEKVNDKSIDLKWNNYEEFLRNKDNLIEYLKTFSSRDFENMYLEAQEKEIVKKTQERYFSTILARLKFKLPLTDMMLVNIEQVYKKLIFELNKEKLFTEIREEENNLEFENKDIKEDIVEYEIEEKRNSEIIKLEQIEENNVEKEISNNSIEEVEDNEKINQEEKVNDKSIDLKWNNYEEFLRNKDNLIEYLKTFSSRDFQNIYLEAKKRGIIKRIQEKYFSNILIRLKLKLPLTTMGLENIEQPYKELIYKMKDEKLFAEIEIEDKVLNFDNENIEKNVIEKRSEEVLSKDFEDKNEDENEDKNIEIVEIQIENFDKLLEQGLKNGEVSIEQVQKINYEEEENVYDIYEAIELLEERGIRIKY